ncbi:hypothetical protein [Alteromonas sp. 14N.309.X.WAT.G.H12]|uniref:hypothetical protein n=1 Tax=Alteromonas sp. 14N.309.X.WAT.G.H12 TaxID=3120824 RepID=UPI002FD421F1
MTAKYILFTIFSIVLAIFILTFFVKKNEYEKFFYSEFNITMDEVSIGLKLHGSHQEKNGLIITGSPYYLKIEIHDHYHNFDSVKLHSLRFRSGDSEATFSLMREESFLFSDSNTNEGNYAAVVFDGLDLLRESYYFYASFEFCNENGMCQHKKVNGLFELRMEKYEQVAFVDTLLSV